MRRALAFLTPLGKPSLPSATTMQWFPLVGAGLGLALGGLWWTTDRLWPAAVAAALVVVADAALTGMLHLDGLADTADGLLPPLDTDRRLAVMSDPRVGAFGVAALFSMLLLRWVALASQRVSVLLIAGLWSASRTAMAVTARSVPYARAEGLASAFLATGRGPGKSGLPVLIGLGTALAVSLAAVGRGWAGVAAVTAVGVGAAVVVAVAKRRIGGFTGDVLGAAGVVGETAGLLVAAARW